VVLQRLAAVTIWAKVYARLMEMMRRRDSMLDDE